MSERHPFAVALEDARETGGLPRGLTVEESARVNARLVAEAVAGPRRGEGAAA